MRRVDLNSNIKQTLSNNLKQYTFMLAKTLLKRNWLFVVIAFTFCVQPIFGQDTFTSVKVNIQNVKISADSKTISYDVYLQDVDPTYKVAVPGFSIQLAVPTTDLDPAKAKSVSLSNVNSELGAKLPTMVVNGANWVMKFQNQTAPTTYAGALLLSETFPGTHLATFSMKNTDGTAFPNPQQFTPTFAGTSPSTKTTVSVFLQDKVALAPNSTAAQPVASFTGLGSSLSLQGQNALTSVKINIQDIKISTDLKTISYDVYLQDVDPTYKVAVPGFGIQLAVPTTDLDPTKAKTVSLSNTSPELGAKLPTMAVIGANWVMKFQNQTAPTTYAGALLLSETFPGTRLGTFNMKNTDGTVFSNPQQFTATFAGTSPQTKSTVSVFLQDQVALAPNSNGIQPSTNFDGLGTHSLTAIRFPLTITGVTASNKVYDGTATATLSGGTLVGINGSDVVTLVPGTGTFADNQIGTDKTVTAAGYDLSGADAYKYRLSDQPSGITASITAKSLIASNPTIISNKKYDGTTVASVTPGTLSGVATGDISNVTLSATAIYDNASVGTGKTITATYTLSGSAAANYRVPESVSLTTGTITAKPLVANAPTITLTKEYDGTNAAAVTAGTLSGVAPVDIANVTLNAAATYNNATVGTAKTITATYSLSGSAAGNYTAPIDTTVTTGSITAKALVVAAPTITLSKAYDGTTTAAIIAGTLSGVLSADTANVILSAAATYDDANIGTDKTITVTYSLSGSASANYTAPAGSSVSTGMITRKLTLKAYLEGLWNGALMNKTQAYDAVNDVLVDKFTGTVADTISVELHDIHSYGKILYQAHGLELHQDGSITTAGLSYIEIPCNVNGDYRLTIKHRNHLEVASASSVSFSSPIVSYDFTDSSARAFKSDQTFTPTKQINDKWMLYAGNVVASDYPEINNDDLYWIFDKNSLGTGNYGYLPEDINGDGFVDDADAYTVLANLFIYFYLP
jgi:hypothetical protein